MDFGWWGPDLLSEDYEEIREISCVVFFFTHQNVLPPFQDVFYASCSQDFNEPPLLHDFWANFTISPDT